VHCFGIGVCGGLNVQRGCEGADDVSQVVLLVDVNPFFWSTEAERSYGTLDVTFHQYF
jgi:hypothetical protein